MSNGAVVRAAAMSREEARRCVERVNARLTDARDELLRLYQGRGWEALGYASWRACVTREFGQSQAHVYRLLSAAVVEGQVSPRGENSPPVPEKVLRPLQRLDTAEGRREVWRQALAEGNGVPPAARVEELVKKARQGLPAERLREAAAAGQRAINEAHAALEAEEAEADRALTLARGEARLRQAARAFRDLGEDAGNPRREEHAALAREVKALYRRHLARKEGAEPGEGEG